jgi:transcriptional regulator with XRE-family HTH domain
MNLNKVLGKNVRKLAAQQNISLEKLAYENDISKGYIYDIANGKANVTLTLLEKLAKALKVKPKDLL